MAAGAPTIVARTGGLAEIVEGTGAGVLFEPGNHIALANCIAEVLEPPGGCRRHAHQGGGAAGRPVHLGRDRRDHARRVQKGQARLSSRPGPGRPAPTRLARMRAVRQFNVVPAIPAPLAALSSLANNIHWTWDRRTQALFARLDPELWESSGHDPLRLIAGITAEPLGRTVGRSRDRRRSPMRPPSAAGRRRSPSRGGSRGRRRQPATTRRLLLPRVRPHRDPAAVLAEVSASSPATI